MPLRFPTWMTSLENEVIIDRVGVQAREKA